MSPFNLITPAQIVWDGDEPQSAQFNDIYFSTDDGVAETEYVFLAANQLAERWAMLESGEMHTLAETGFGTGLNFLCARRLWLQVAPVNARLHFISCEKYPLKLEDLERALSAFEQSEELSAGAAQLFRGWPLPLIGFHRLSFDQGRIELTLLFGDATEQLAKLNASVDTWFLDGFAPAKNPEMWSDLLFKQISRLSRVGARVASFTSAGIVKRGLESVGFTVSKQKGFGRKREMIIADYTQTQTATQAHQYQHPWLARPVQTKPKRIAVIGAGISGACTAWALSKRGLSVDIYERGAAIANAGSSNPQGALYIKLPAKPQLQSRFHLAGLQYSLSLIRMLGLNNGEIADLCGLLQIAKDFKDQQVLYNISQSGIYPKELLRSVSATKATELAGTVIEKGGLYFPNSGWVAPQRLAEHLISLSGASLKLNQAALSIKCSTDGWRINGSDEYTHIVFCTAWQTDLIDELTELSLKPIRGQTTLVSAESADQLRCVVCSEGYISPALAGRYCFGSSFKAGDSSTEIRPAEHQHNRDLLSRVLPALAAQLLAQEATGNAASRAGSRDYLPLSGPLCSSNEMKLRYAKLRNNAKSRFEGIAPWSPGLYVNLGQGSKGLVTCPLTAELIASQICDEPLPLEQALVDLISPQRFTLRALKRSQR